MNHSDPATVRMRLDLAYDGAAFSGWAAQPGRRTVEGELTAGVERVVRTSVRLAVAGRTDAGVHAAGQVAHLDLSADQIDRLRAADGDPAEALTRRLAGVLPADIVVRRAQIAPPGFDARFAALWRRYRYRICDERAVRNPLTRGHVLWVQRAVDVAVMSQAAAPLLGLHDFAAYAKPRPGSSTVRELQRLEVLRTGPGQVEVWVQADAFCHNMVRALVGTLLDVGWGRRDSGHPAAVLASRSRVGAGAVVPPHGLVLEEVGYPPAAQMSARVELTRSGRRDGAAGIAAPAAP